MASIINADSGISSSVTGITFSADNSGALNIQTNGVTAIAISSSQAVSFPATTSLNFGSANITTLTSSSATITNLIATSASITTLTNNPTFGAGTANGMLYLNGSKVVTSGSAVVFDGANIGLGVTPSATGSGYKSFQIGAVNGLYMLGGAGVAQIGSNYYFNSGYKYASNGVATNYETESGAHKWYTAASGTTGNAITFTQAMTLDASGNLLVGTTTHANYSGGTTEVTIGVTGTGTTTGGAITFVNGSGLISYLGGQQSETALGTYTSTPLVFTTNNTERARFDTSGNLCVGSTSPGSAGTVNVSVGNPGTTVGGVQLWSTTSGTHYVQFGDSTNAADPYRGAVGYVHSSDAMTFWTSSTERASFDSTGRFIVKQDTTKGPMIGAAGVSMADDATITIPSDDAGAMLICAYEGSGGKGGVALANYASTAILVANGGNFAATDSDGDLCVYKNASSHVVTVKNRLGATRTVFISVYAAKTN